MDLNALRIFVYVVEQGSFVQASKALDMPASNVSRAVTQLEKQLNCQLLIRTTRSLRMTEFGELLFSTAQPLISNLEATKLQLSNMQDELQGALNIVIPSESGPLLLGDVLTQFASNHPQLQLNIQTNFLGLENLQNSIDLALFFHRGDLSDSTMVVRKIRSFESIIVASPALLKHVKMPQKITHLTTLPCITTSSALNRKPWCFNNAEGGFDFISGQNTFSVDSGLLAAKAAIAGLGFAILTKEMCQKEIEQKRLIPIKLDQQPAALELLLAYPQQKHLSPAVRVLIDAIMHYFSD